MGEHGRTFFSTNFSLHPFVSGAVRDSYTIRANLKQGYVPLPYLELPVVVIWARALVHSNRHSTGWIPLP